MASYSRADGAQENTITVKETSSRNPEAHYECPVCLNWLKDPSLTSCGHRFCSKCITSWLQREGKCPIDQQPLNCETDVFPDNFTRREISQIKLPCSYSANGCKTNLSPMDIESHEIGCIFKKNLEERNDSDALMCTFYKLGCKIKFNDQNDLDDHLRVKIQDHLNLLLVSHTSLNNVSVMASVSTLWDSPQKQNDMEHPESSQSVSEINIPNLIHALYERIVILEQRNQEQELRLKSLTNKSSNLNIDDKMLEFTELLETKYCNGVHLWKIDNFKNKLQQMKSNPEIMYYSKGILTSPYGYGFCARINISTKEPNWLALHLHMMKTDHDLTLNWPFSGRINLTLVHPSDTSKSQQDTIMSRSEILAFQQPSCDISPRGFGFLNYTSLLDIFEYLDNDTLIIKLHIQTV